MMRSPALLGMLLLILTPLGAAQADMTRVAVAANFTAPMQELAARFAQATGHEAQLSFGSTGKLYAQINHGAPFDVMLSADDTTPAKLLDDGHAVAGTQFTYARGKLALWSVDNAMVDDRGAVLERGEFVHLAIANPTTAPYGAAAMQALEALGLAESLRGTLVQGESIAQAYQFAATGNAELGFVALAQIYREDGTPEGSAWQVPEELHDPIRQDAVLLTRGEHNAAARALLDYLRGPEARELIARYGYGAGE